MPVYSKHITNIPLLLQFVVSEIKKFPLILNLKENNNAVNFKLHAPITKTITSVGLHSSFFPYQNGSQCQHNKTVTQQFGKFCIHISTHFKFIHFIVIGNNLIQQIASFLKFQHVSVNELRTTRSTNIYSFSCFNILFFLLHINHKAFQKQNL